MATPRSTTSHEGDGDKKDGQITFIFCDECSNMLYPKEDEDTRKLQLTCRTCHFTKSAESSCVFRNVLNNAAGETAGVTQDVGSDPTVGAPPSPNTVSSVSPHSMAVLCFCCGALFACHSCGVVFCKLASSPSETSATSAATTTTTTAASTNDTPTVSPSLRDLDDLDLYPYDYDFEDVTNTAGMFPEDDCLDYDNDYEFMDGCEETASALGNDAVWLTRLRFYHSPQLPRSNKSCPECSNGEAVFFQSQQRSAETGMKLFYVCCQCGFIFQ